MDTKSKNKRLPAFARMILICLAALALLLAIDIYKHREYMYGNPFFDGELFYSVQVQMNIHQIVKFYTEYRNYDQLSAKEKVSEDTIKQWRLQFDDIMRGKLYLEGNPDIESSGQPYSLSNSTIAALESFQQKNRQWLSEEWNKQVEGIWQSQLEDNIKKYLVDRDSEYEILKRALARLDPIIKYSITDTRNQLTYSNRKDDANRDHDSESVRIITFPMWEPIESLKWLDDYFKQNKLQGTFTFYANVEPPGYPAFGTETVMYKDYITLYGIRQQLQNEVVGLSVALVAVALLLVYIIRSNRAAAGDRWGESFMAHWQQIPVDIRIGGLIMVLIAVFGYGGDIYNWGMRNPSSPVYRWTLLAALIAYICITLSDAFRLYRIKGYFAAQWDKGYVVTLYRLIVAGLDNKHMLAKAALLFVSTSLLGLCALTVSMQAKFWAPLAVAYMAGYFLVVVPYLFKRAETLNRLFAGMDEIAAGQLNVALEQDATGKGELSHRIRQLHSMKLGFKNALDRQLKSERLKSELISNVSHDLKTPLTSMINYVDLLRKESPLPGDSERYVQVLANKTERLKVLIDDLFEVSQLSSGAVVPVMETVDVAALLQQTLAECSDKIEASRLQFRIHVDPPHMYARLDGKKTWRVFENLIHNAIHYSMPNTRVHVSLNEEQEHVVLRINNVSAYEITCDAEELFERSKRGDASRNTEGSGLGLAIAKSIVELQGGTLHIGIDGDYFKVTVTFSK